MRLLHLQLVTCARMGTVRAGGAAGVSGFADGYSGRIRDDGARQILLRPMCARAARAS